MFRSLIRSGIVALCIFSFLSATPARALPLAGETEGFPFSLSALWERLVSPIVALWTDTIPGTCTPSGGYTNGGGGTTTDGRGTCDPNG